MDDEPVYVDWCSDCGYGLAEGDYHACQLPYVESDEEEESPAVRSA